MKTRHNNRLRALRLEKGVSRGELSRRTGIAYPNIWKHETGQHAMSASTASRYAQALDVRVSDLYIDMPAT
jgi:DNA-binding XRE family transcriptional regulator